MFGSSKSWGLQQHPHPWHFRAGGGAVHSIKSGHSHCSISIRSPLGAGEHGRRNFEAERFGSLEVNYKFVFSRCLHRQVGRLFCLEDTIHIAGRALVLVDLIRPVGGEGHSGGDRERFASNKKCASGSRRPQRVRPVKKEKPRCSSSRKDSLSAIS